MEERLGKYRLLHLLATGGMGEVFLARQEGPAGFSKTVVVKRILRHLADDQGFIDMFLNEARLAAQLQHPNIVQIFGLEHEEDTYFIAMEHVHGRSLRACLEAAKAKPLPFPPAIAARLCAQALLGLQFAHRLSDSEGRPLGILHRDVSPENVLVSFSGTVKLLDFGIAKAVRDSTVTGRLKGKLTYMAPEQFIAGATIDARIDVFATGVMLHELLLGEPPAQTPRGHEDLATPRPPYQPRPEVPEALNEVLRQALEPDPSRRFASAQAFADALEAYIQSTGEPVTPVQVAAFVEQLFGAEAVMSNPSVTVQPIAFGRTDVMAIPQLSEPTSQKVRDMLAGSPTLIEPAFQGRQRRDSEPPRGVPLDESVAVTATATRIPERAPGRRGTVAVVAAALLGALVGGLLLAGPFKGPATSGRERPDAGVEAWVLKAVDAGERVMPVVDISTLDAEEEDLPAPPPVVHHRPPPRGKVTVRVNPWAEVFYAGKSYGVTPLKRPVEVPPGNAVFVLKNSQLNVTRKVTVRVAPGAEVVLKADLFRK